MGYNEYLRSDNVTKKMLKQAEKWEHELREFAFVYRMDKLATEDKDELERIDNKIARIDEMIEQLTEVNNRNRNKLFLSNRLYSQRIITMSTKNITQKIFALVNKFDISQFERLEIQQIVNIGDDEYMIDSVNYTGFINLVNCRISYMTKISKQLVTQYYIDNEYYTMFNSRMKYY